MIVEQQCDLTSIEMFSRLVVRQRRFAMHQMILRNHVCPRSRNFSSLTSYSHGQIEQKQPEPLSLGGLMNSNIRTQDALMIGIVKGAIKDAQHSATVASYEAQLRATNLMQSIEDRNAQAVDNLLRTRILSKEDLQGALTYAESQINLWQIQIDSKSWWNQLGFNQRKYQTGKSQSIAVHNLIKIKLEGLPKKD